VAALTGLCAFYGIWAVLLNVGAGAFRSFARDSVSRDVGPWDIIHAVLFRTEVLTLGTSLNHWFTTILLGCPMLGVIVLGIVKVAKPFWGHVPGQNRRPMDVRVCSWLGNPRGFCYTFWVGMLGLLALLILPGGAGDYTHYGYPAAAALSVLFVMALVDAFSPRIACGVLAVVCVVHFAFLPRSVATTSKMLENYLLPDHTVTTAEVNAINRIVKEFKRDGRSPLFDSMNNRKDIDLSGTWYYSRVKGFGPSAAPHFPLLGTVKVLLWPYHQNLR
jgi:hypothetical protein